MLRRRLVLLPASLLPAATDGLGGERAGDLLHSLLLHGCARTVLPGSLHKGILLPGVAGQAVLLFPERVLGDRLHARTVGRALLAFEETALHLVLLLRASLAAQKALPGGRGADQGRLVLPGLSASGHTSLPGEAQKARRPVAVQVGTGDQHRPDAAGFRASASGTNLQEGRHPLQTVPRQSCKQAFEGTREPETLARQQPERRHQQQQQLPKHLQPERAEEPRLRSGAQSQAPGVLEDSPGSVRRVPADQERVR